ncbi:hypothetical protein [Streptomyces sp. AD55]
MSAQSEQERARQAYKQASTQRDPANVQRTNDRVRANGAGATGGAR